MSNFTALIAILFAAGALTARSARTWPAERRGWVLMFAALCMTVGLSMH